MVTLWAIESDKYSKSTYPYDDGGYSQLIHVDFSNNEDLEIDVVDFVDLDGQTLSKNSIVVDP